MEPVTAVSFTAAGEFIVSAAADGSVMLWHASDNYEHITTRFAPAEEVGSLALDELLPTPEIGRAHV